MGNSLSTGQVSTDSFGNVIGYVLPGAIAIAVAGLYSPTIGRWVGANGGDAPTIGGFLYATLASIAAGMTVSALRWLIVDTVNHRTGIARPSWDFAKLQSNVPAFERLVEHHYKHYLYYGNMVIALAMAAASPRVYVAFSSVKPPALGFALLVLILIHYIASRDVLRKYYERTNALLG